MTSTTMMKTMRCAHQNRLQCAAQAPLLPRRAGTAVVSTVSGWCLSRLSDMSATLVYFPESPLFCFFLLEDRKKALRLFSRNNVAPENTRRDAEYIIISYNISMRVSHTQVPPAPGDDRAHGGARSHCAKTRASRNLVADFFKRHATPVRGCKIHVP